MAATLYGFAASFEQGSRLTRAGASNLLKGVLLPLLFLCATGPASPQDAGATAPAPAGTAVKAAAQEPSVEDEVRRNVLAQPIGPGTVADLALPDAYVERVVDRIVRASFDERVGVVVPEEDDEDTETPEELERSERDGRALVYAAGYALLALGFAGWFALRARKGTA